MIADLRRESVQKIVMKPRIWNLLNQEAMSLAQHVLKAINAALRHFFFILRISFHRGDDMKKIIRITCLILILAFCFSTFVFALDKNEANTEIKVPPHYKVNIKSGSRFNQAAERLTERILNNKV